MEKLINFARSGFNKEPWYLIFAVTAKCNQQCVMCFYWKNIQNWNVKQELTLDEILLIAPNFNNLFQLTLSGGEPLLRSDCIEIAKIFARYTPVQRITLPTNGTLPVSIEKFIKEFCKSYPNISLSVNLSLDGLSETHDRIRGMPGAFKKFLESFELLDELRKKYKNLIRCTATTVSTQNQNEIFELVDFVESRLDIVNHGLMLARGDMFDPILKSVPVEKFVDMLSYLREKCMKKVGFVNKVVYGLYYERWINSLQKQKMIDPCLAGRKLLILNEVGVLSPCEMLEHLRCVNKLNIPFDGDFIFGNLRDYGYNLNAILNTTKAKEIVKFIRKVGCWCSFECAMINNFFANPANYPRIVGRILHIR